MLRFAAAALLASLALLPFGGNAAEPAYDWTGAYVGLSLGGVVLGGNATTDLPEVPAVTAPPDGQLQPQLGVNAGYNVMLDDFLLLGVEADTTFTLPDGTAN